jgi:putative acetyltransferase
MIIVREEAATDIDAVREINELAFDQPGEAILVDKLRERCADILSLVAVQDGQVVGHIFFSPVVIESGTGTGSDMGSGLGPMAVRPEYQNQGIGTALVREGLARLEGQGCGFVVVLGHPRYYPRFGFVRAGRYGVSCEWDVPDEVFMIQVFGETILSGLARYRPEFSDLA